MWTVASIPFWILGAVLVFVGVCACYVGLRSKVYERGRDAGRLVESQHVYFVLGLGYLVCGGAVFILAGKIAS